MKSHNQTGSHVVGMALAVLVIAVVAFAGMRVMNHKSSNSSPTVPTQIVTSPTKIQSKSDLQQAATSLNSSSSDINNDLNTDSLNSNLNDLL